MVPVRMKTDLAAVVESILLAPYGGVRPALTRPIRCPACGGSGYANTHFRGDEREEKCRRCEGSGELLMETKEAA